MTSESVQKNRRLRGEGKKEDVTMVWRFSPSFDAHWCMGGPDNSADSVSVELFSGVMRREKVGLAGTAFLNFPQRNQLETTDA